MPRVVEGTFDGSGLRIGIVVARFNEFASAALLQAALDSLREHGVADDAVEVAWVPGSFELPLVARRLARSDRFQAVIALGAVIRGDTAHFEYVAGEAAGGIARVAYETGVPVIFGVVTADTVEQVMERVGPGRNKGWDAALAALEMATLLRQLDHPAASASVRTRAGFR